MFIIGILFFLLGASFGSFLNALEWRIKNNLSLLERSLCTQCRKEIKWYDNVPILSFFILKRKCRYCHKNISWQYPIVELLMGLGWMAIWFYSTQGLSILPITRIIYECAVFWIFTFIFVFDLKYGEVLDSFTLVPALVVIFLSFFLGWNSWQNLLIGVIVGGGFFAIQYVVSHGRWIGGGDIRIGILMGAILGWPKIIAALGIAYIFGALISIILLVSKNKKIGDSTPLGTYLSVATIITYFLGDGIIGCYLSLIS